MDFNTIYDEANEALLDQQELEDRYYDLFKLIVSKFPECKIEDETKGGSEYTTTAFIKRPLKAGLGWTQVNQDTFKIDRVLISDKALSCDGVHYDSIIAHEAAHVAAYNFLVNETDIPDLMEWKETKGHTKKWHEIIDWMNHLKDKKSGEQAFDIVEKITEENIGRYFPS